MRPSNAQARAALVQALQRHGPLANAELLRRLGVSAPSLHRMLRELGQDVVSAGQTRTRRHALRRQLRGLASTLPIFRIDESGIASHAGNLDLVYPAGCHADLPPEWPQDAQAQRWWGGLPYPLYDMRPQGYLGRLIAHALAAPLHVPQNPDHWNDDQILAYLIQYGSDTAGNLVVGEQAMQSVSSRRTHGKLDVIASRSVGPRYAELAERAVGEVGVGSSAGGEFPKFTAARQLNGAATPHVIVKFSGSDKSPAVRRWSDLLVCEHLALEALREAGRHEVARSRIIQFGGRTFLESERFDRHGDHGRSALVSLSAVDAALIGSGETQWPLVLRVPAARRFVSEAQAARGEELFWFGRFIANADMHTGNLSLRPRGDSFELAPTYDMLPMRYAPQRGGEVTTPAFGPTGFPHPPAGRQEDWERMLQAALAFWQAASADSRITAKFRQVCARNVKILRSWAATYGAG